MNLLNDYVEGRLGGIERVLHKVAVLEVDVVGGKLAGPASGDGKRSKEPPNPPGSFVGRIITDAADTYTDDDNLPVFWPLFPHDLMPIKESEHAYVIFEDPEQHHGLWIARIPEPNDVNNLNITPGSKRYTSDSANDLQENSPAAEQAVQDLDEDPGIAEVNPEIDQETDDVLPFNYRVGDRVIQGSNNTMIAFSRDRIDAKDSGVRAQAGSIDVVAGRDGSDIDLDKDAARVVVSMKTDGDTNFELGDFGESGGETSYVVAKANEVRLIGRVGVKIVVEDGPTSVVIQQGKVTITTTDEVKVATDSNLIVEAKENIVLDAGGETHVGVADALHPIPRADELKTYLDGVFAIYNAMVVDVAGIPGIGIANSAVATAVGAVPWDNVPSNDNKVE